MPNIESPNTAITAAMGRMQQSAIISPIFTPSDPEHVTVERFTRIWQTFAETGNPNNRSDEFLAPLNWNKLDLNMENYLDFGNHMVEKSGLFLDRFAMWDEFDEEKVFSRS